MFNNGEGKFYNFTLFFLTSVFVFRHNDLYSDNVKVLFLHTDRKSSHLETKKKGKTKIKEFINIIRVLRLLLLVIRVDSILDSIRRLMSLNFHLLGLKKN